jgi:predicted nucleic acid-binding protein
MTVIIDTNILISACLNEQSEIFKILNTLSQTIDFVIPDYAIEEIEKHKSSICNSTGRDKIIFNKLLKLCCDKGIIIAAAEISTGNFKLAEDLTSKIDINDKAFVAFSIALNAPIWTGDLKLSRGLKRAGFKNIISTRELKDIIKGL